MHFREVRFLRFVYKSSSSFRISYWGNLPQTSRNLSQTEIGWVSVGKTIFQTWLLVQDLFQTGLWISQWSLLGQFAPAWGKLPQRFFWHFVFLERYPVPDVHLNTERCNFPGSPAPSEPTWDKIIASGANYTMLGQIAPGWGKLTQRFF